MITVSVTVRDYDPDQATRALAQELHALKVEDLTYGPGAAAPSNSKGLDAVGKSGAAKSGLKPKSALAHTAPVHQSSAPTKTQAQARPRNRGIPCPRSRVQL
jgi:hypothetical protein